MKSLLLPLLLLACAVQLKAQVLTPTLQRLKAHRNASYTDVVTSQFSFQEKASTDSIQSAIAFVPGEAQTGGYFALKGPDMQDVFDGSRHIQLYLADSTYSIKKDAVTGQHTRTLLYWTRQLETFLKTPKQIKALPDTFISNKRYSHISITQFDSLHKQTHVYARTGLVIDPQTHLPLMIKDEWGGQADDGTAMSFYEIHYYLHLRFDAPHFPDLSFATVPAGFKLPAPKQPTRWLARGSIAPELKLYDMNGRELQLSALKGKTVLLNFTWIGCPHCVGATQMLNELAARYPAGEVVLASIYPLDTREAVRRYDQRFSAKASSYTADKSIREIYPYEGYPAFYLVDKGGRIAQSYNGFYKELKEELTGKINSIK